MKPHPHPPPVGFNSLKEAVGIRVKRRSSTDQAQIKHRSSTDQAQIKHSTRVKHRSSTAQVLVIDFWFSVLKIDFAVSIPKTRA